MPRAFTTADVVQHTTGQISVLADPGVALPNPVVEGNCGVLVIVGATQLDSPANWHILARSGTASTIAVQLGIMCRADLPAGEQSWPIQALAGTATNFAWVAEEWTNVSYAPLQGFVNAAGAGGVSSLATGSTGSFDAPYVAGIAAAAVIDGPGTGAAWPTASFSNSFTITDTLQVGTGAASNDLKLWVARRYGTLNDTGPWDTTVTFTGTMTSRSAYGCLAVLRAENYVGEA